MASQKQFDIVVFGATGFTGIRVVRYLAKRAKPQIKIAIAGRSKEQLESILASLNLKGSWGIILASYNESSSISDMANAGQIIINCVGPYRHFGLSLPEACVQAHSDYLDVCGEPEFLERTQLECHDNAAAAGSLIVGSCGFDSVPSDLGGCFLFEKLQARGARPVTSIECFMSFHYGLEGMSLHYPTYESAIYGMANVLQLKKVRQKLSNLQTSNRKSRKPKDAHRVSRGKRFFYDSRVKKWVVPFPVADSSVLRRSFQVLAQDEPYLPEVTVFLSVSSLLWAIIISIWGAFIMFLSGFSVTRELLLQYPGFFSLGTVKRSGPSEKQMMETGFEINIFGRGTDNSSGSEIQAIVRVSGPELGYVATPIIIGEAALVLLSERDKLRFQGGVFTPGAAFQGSSLRSKLHDAGVRFDVIE